MADIAADEILQEIALADEEKVRARNYVLGSCFADGVPDRSRFGDAAEVLRALGLDWREPPGLLPIRDMPSALDVDPKSRGLRSRKRM